QFHKPKDLAISLMLEAAEVAELFQWKDQAEIEELLVNKKEELGDELCDVLYWLLLMSHSFGVNLEESWERKMAKNEAKYPIDKSKGNHKKYTEI
ncbi:MAG: MazG-like family protein, partial [Patescibacteria group bacterium]